MIHVRSASAMLSKKMVVVSAAVDAGADADADEDDSSPCVIPVVVVNRRTT